MTQNYKINVEGGDDIGMYALSLGYTKSEATGVGTDMDRLNLRFNTDIKVFKSDKKALLLGTGGVSKAIQYALREMGIAFTVVSRLGVQEVRSSGGSDEAMRRLGYEEVDEEVMRAHTVIVNCTPLGMHPYEKEMPAIPYQYLTEAHLLYDCIYNPEKTLFLQMGEEHGCRVKNGLEMLHMQADAAWEIWYRS